MNLTKLPITLSIDCQTKKNISRNEREINMRRKKKNN